MPEADEALEAFQVLVERLIVAVRRVMEIQRKPPHYVAALTIAAGCEAAGELLESIDGKKRKSEDIFIDELVVPRGILNRYMGRDLFRALRHGIAHMWDTKFIELSDGRRIELVVSWSRRPHFTLRHDPLGLYLSLPDMQQDFEAMLGKHLDTVRRTPVPGRRLSDRWRLEATRRAEPGAEAGWSALLEGSLLR